VSPVSWGDGDRIGLRDPAYQGLEPADGTKVARV
jgi:hypothetical protein